MHCPHCHELVDTSDAVAGRVDPCPYCGSHINKLDLGLMNAQGIISSQLSDPIETKLSWTGLGLAEPRKRFRLSFGWVADLFVLIVLILMVWVLAQLPVWFNWTHLYY